ncbi:MAG TPA: CvpA family protein [Ignavibacteria bacterium]|nr:CvpA family protein [Ignavibacteria bacterium]
MNKLDIIIFTIVLIPALLGLKNGFLRSIFALIGIITGLFLATVYNDKLSSFLGFLKTDPKLLSIMSFVIIIVFTYIVFVTIAGKISRFNFITKTLDKILGVCFGILKGFIIASLILLLSTSTINFFSKKEIETSKFYSSVINIAPDVYNYIQIYFPNAKEFYDELNKIFDPVKKSVLLNTISLNYKLMVS